MEDFEIISSYTAAQAEEDGILVNVSDLAAEVGIKWTTRISIGVHQLCTPPKSNKIQSYTGRLWDVLFLAKRAITAAKNNNRPVSWLIAFKVKIGREIHQMWATVDSTMGEPAIHIILPEEY